MKSAYLLIAVTVSLAFQAHCQSPVEPKELLDLRASFEKARSAALSPLEKKYVEALVSMKDRLTKKGDLNGALAVQAEISKLQPPAAPVVRESGLRLSKFKTVDEFTAWLETTTWKTAAGSVLRFGDSDSLTVTKADGSVATYQVTVATIGVVTWTYLSTGKQDTITLDANLKTGQMKSVGHIEREDAK